MQIPRRSRCNTCLRDQKGEQKSSGLRVLKVFTTKCLVSKAREADLVSLCTNGIIPEEYLFYYNGIPTTSSMKDKIPIPNAEESDCSKDSDE